MADLYTHHRVMCAPRRWQAVADAFKTGSADRLAAEGGVLYGVWRSQIGTPRDELNVITAWPTGTATDTAKATALLSEGVADVRSVESVSMTPTLRPERIDPPQRQGNFAFRWFETPTKHWPEFLDLCAGAWPGFESSYDSQVIGLWQTDNLPGGGHQDDTVRSLLLTRRPDLAMWERSKIPANPEEEEVRRKLSRRYDLCEWTMVYTTTLLTAKDREDTARWT